MTARASIPSSGCAGAQTKLPVVVPNFHFYPVRLCVPKRVAQRLARNPINLVPEDWMEAARLAFDLDLKDGRTAIRRIGREFLSERAHGQCSSPASTWEERSCCTASRPSVIAPAACSITLSSFRLEGPSGSRFETV